MSGPQKHHQHQMCSQAVYYLAHPPPRLEEVQGPLTAVTQRSWQRPSQDPSPWLLRPVSVPQAPPEISAPAGSQERTQHLLPCPLRAWPGTAPTSCRVPAASALRPDSHAQPRGGGTQHPLLRAPGPAPLCHQPTCCGRLCPHSCWGPSGPQSHPILSSPSRPASCCRGARSSSSRPQPATCTSALGSCPGTPPVSHLLLTFLTLLGDHPSSPLRSAGELLLTPQDPTSNLLLIPSLTVPSRGTADLGVQLPRTPTAAPGRCEPVSLLLRAHTPDSRTGVWHSEGSSQRGGCTTVSPGSWSSLPASLGPPPTELALEHWREAVRQAPLPPCLPPFRTLAPSSPHALRGSDPGRTDYDPI